MAKLHHTNLSLDQIRQLLLIVGYTYSKNEVADMVEELPQHIYDKACKELDRAIGSILDNTLLNQNKCPTCGTKQGEKRR